MRTLAKCAFVVILAAAGVAAAQPSLQSSTILLQPANSIGAGCPMLSAATALRTELYTTAAAEGGRMVFHDPLPPDVVLSHLEVKVSSLATCFPSNELTLQLNPAVVVQPSDALIGTFTPFTSMTSCSTPARFSTDTRFFHNVMGPQVSPYVRGGLNEITISETSGGCGDVRIENAQITFHYWVNVPAITFDLTTTSPVKDRKLLMKQFRTDFPYYMQQSFYPVTAPPLPIPHMGGTATNPNGTPYANATIYVRTSDPADPAPYLPAGQSKYFDNPFGIGGYPNALGFGWATVTTDGAGRFETDMPFVGGVGPMAGDNVELQASAIFLPLPYSYWNFGTLCTQDLRCYRSGDVTLWRRVFIENDRMFRQGSFIRENVAAGATEIPIYRTRAFNGASPNNPIPIVLIRSNHDPHLPAVVDMEQRNVIGVRGHGARRILVLDQAVTFSYQQLQQTFGNRDLPIGDAVGRLMSSADLFPAEVADARAVFNDTSTELVILSSPTQNKVPYLPLVGECPDEEGWDSYCYHVGLHWFENKVGNHQYVISGAASRNAGIVGRVDLFGHAMAIIYTARIEDAVNSNHQDLGGLPLRTAIMEVTAHELVHMFDVNQPRTASNGGHCVHQAWDQGACLMNPARTRAERGDGRVSLHVTPWDQSEYRRIRRRLDPLPVNFQLTYDPNW